MTSREYKRQIKAKKANRRKMLGELHVYLTQNGIPRRVSGDPLWQWTPHMCHGGKYGIRKRVRMVENEQI